MCYSHENSGNRWIVLKIKVFSIKFIFNKHLTNAIPVHVNLHFLTSALKNTIHVQLLMQLTVFRTINNFPQWKILTKKINTRWVVRRSQFDWSMIINSMERQIQFEILYIRVIQLRLYFIFGVSSTNQAFVQ